MGNEFQKNFNEITEDDYKKSFKDFDNYLRTKFKK